MNTQDERLLMDLCKQYNISFEKVCRLLESIKEFQLKDRRTGIYDVLKDIIKSDLHEKQQ